MPSSISSSYPLDLVVDPASNHWLERTLALLRDTGFAIVPDIVSEHDRGRARSGLSRVKLAQRAALAHHAGTLERAENDREVRFLMEAEPSFLDFLEYPALLAVIDAFLSPTATLRFQQASVIAAGPNRTSGPWHMNFRRVLNGYRAALEVGFAIDDIEPGLYHFALGSHQQPVQPELSTLEAVKRTFLVPAGSMFVFDGTLWHHEGAGDPGTDRLLVMHQFVPHFVKPHVDYVRALGAPAVAALAPRTRRLLGWDSRVPASLEEFYADPADRFYKPGQG